MNWTDKEQTRKYHQDYYAANKHKWGTEEERARQALWRATNVAKTLLHSAKKRAKVKNLLFDIVYTDVVVPDNCPVLGVPLVIKQAGDKTHGRYSPSLDRIIPSLGYVKGNIQVISHLANAMKQDATAEELLKFAEWVGQAYG